MLFGKVQTNIFEVIREEAIEVGVDGIVIRGKILKTENLPVSAPAVVILHGIPQSKPTPGDPGYLPMARDFAAAGFLTVLLSFRGCGESEGNFSILGWAEDLESLINWLAKKYSPAGIGLLGFSGGGAIAIYTAAHDPRISAVVAASSPANLNALAADAKVEAWLENFRAIGLIRDPGFPASAPDWLDEFETVKPVSWVERISPRPMLIIHGDQDTIVPVAHAWELFDKAREPKELFLIKDGPHRLRLEQVAVKKAREWMEAWKKSLEER